MEKGIRCDWNDSFHELGVEFEKAEAALSINLIQFYRTDVGLKLRENFLRAQPT